MVLARCRAKAGKRSGSIAKPFISSTGEAALAILIAGALLACPGRPSVRVDRLGRLATYGTVNAPAQAVSAGHIVDR